MVVISLEAYEKKRLEHEIYFKLKEAELQAQNSTLRYSHNEVFGNLRKTLQDKVGVDDV